MYNDLRVSLRRLSRMWLLAGLGGCSASPPAGVFDCGAGQRCPDRQYCHSDGICYGHRERGAKPYASDASTGDRTVPDASGLPEPFGEDAHVPFAGEDDSPAAPQGSSDAGSGVGAAPSPDAGRTQEAPPGAPRLRQLEVTRGVLSPTFDPDVTAYRVELPLLADSLAIRMRADDDTSIALDGQPLGATGERALTSLPVGETTLIAALEDPLRGSRVYTVTLARSGAQRAFLKASNPGAGDAFGTSVAADRDTLVVGAPGEDSAATGVNGNGDDDSASNSGAAYVFERAGDNFTQVAYLKPTAAAAGAGFGWFVAIEGDTIAVGAPDIAGGAVYLFAREQGVWRARPNETLRAANAGDDFGQAIALRGDLLAVGAPSEDAGANASGAVHVFAREPGGVRDVARLTSPDPQGSGFLGSSIALGDNLIVSGATAESHAVIGAGVVYAFELRSQGYEALPRLVASNAGAADFFGEAVALVGGRLVVGAFGASLGSIATGAVYDFERLPEGYRERAVLGASNRSSDSYFGSRVAAADHVLVVAASNEDSAARGVNGELGSETLEQSGAAYVFVRRDEGYRQLAHLKADRPRAGDLYGCAVALSGDSIYVGAKGEASSARGVNGDSSNAAAQGSGAVYVVR